MKQFEGMVPGKFTVSVDFYNIVIPHYPGLKKNPAYYTLFLHLAFGSWCDTETGNLLISQALLAEIEGKLPQLLEGNYVAERFLEAFAKDVQTFVWSAWSYEDKKVRQVLELHWPPAVQSAINAEKNKVWKESERVYFHTGQKYTRFTQKKYRDEELAQALEYMKDCGSEEAKNAINYLHALPVQLFNNLRQHIGEAMEIADKLPVGGTEQKLVLSHFADQTLPIYKAVKTSPRIFPMTFGLGLLQHDIRKCLTRDWTEMDLKSCELAIVATVWNIPEVKQFLASGQSVWLYLCQHMGIEYTSDNKAVLKDALYCVCFGGGLEMVYEQLKPLKISHAEYLFTSNPLVKAVWEARNRKITEIKQDRGAENFYGQFIAIDDMTHKKREKERIKSVLAQTVQSYELALLYPVFKLAMSEEGRHPQQGFKICLFQHDGLSIIANDRRNTDRWIKRIQQAVSVKAAELDITTYLEVQ